MDGVVGDANGVSYKKDPIKSQETKKQRPENAAKNPRDSGAAVHGKG
jgi:hypothetical protein